MGMFDRWREHKEHRRKAVADRQVRLTINYTRLVLLGVGVVSLSLSMTPGMIYQRQNCQLVIEAPWSLVKPFVFDPDKLRELVPGFDCSILEFVQ